MFADGDKQNIAIGLAFKNYPITATDVNWPQPFKFALQAVQSKGRVQRIGLKNVLFFSGKERLNICLIWLLVN